MSSFYIFCLGLLLFLVLAFSLCCRGKIFLVLQTKLDHFTSMSQEILYEKNKNLKGTEDRRKGS